MKKIFLLDASAFIAGIEPLGEKCCTLREIIAELESGVRLKAELGLQEGSLVLLEAEEKHIDKVNKVAQNSGDIARLSGTDVKLLACALHLKEEGPIALLSDDYSVQNVARLLGIEFIPLTERGIKKVFVWRKICRGCGKKFPASYTGACDMCGREVKQVRKKV